MKTLTFYRGTANPIWLTLMYQGCDDPAIAPVPADTLTRAMFSFGTYCVDTSNLEHNDMIAFNADKTELTLKIGLVAGVLAGSYHGRLTVFDAASQPLAWEDYSVEVKEWKTCPAA